LAFHYSFSNVFINSKQSLSIFPIFGLNADAFE